MYELYDKTNFPLAQKQWAAKNVYLILLFIFYKCGVIVSYRNRIDYVITLVLPERIKVGEIIVPPHISWSVLFCLLYSATFHGATE